MTRARPRRPVRARLHYIDDGAPEETTQLFEAACAARGLELTYVDAPSFDYAPERRARPGDVLYRPAASLAAIKVEQYVHGPGVGTLYDDDAAMFFHNVNAPLWYERAGLPIAPTIFGATADRAVLRGHVGALGGLPVIVKTMGFSGGAGVVRADSLPALFSLVDYAHAHGHDPLLCKYLGDAEHWRVIVLGGRALVAYRNARRPDDFRTHATADPSAYTKKVPRALAKVAAGAARAQRVAFAGVDLMVAEDGGIFLLEANFPCYFVHAQRLGRVDVAGAILDHLRAKASARARSAASREPKRPVDP